MEYNLYLYIYLQICLSLYRWCQPTLFQGTKLFTHFLKGVAGKILYLRGGPKFKEKPNFQGELDDFTDKISFTQYKLHNSKYLTLLNELNVFGLIKKINQNGSIYGLFEMITFVNITFKKTVNNFSCISQQHP